MAKVEDLMEELKKKYTAVAVTYNMQRRVFDYTAFFCWELIEFNTTDHIFKCPSEKKQRTYYWKIYRRRKL